MGLIIRNFLDITCQPFDYLILFFANLLNEKFGYLYFPLVRIFDLLGKKAIVFIILIIILAMRKKTRKYSLCMFITLLLVTVLSHLLLKNIVMRLRPYQSDIANYINWWKNAGSFENSSFSFPSNHVTITTAILFNATKMNKNKLLKLFSILAVLFMSFSRICIYVHYPTDCLFGIIIGLILSYIGYEIYITIWPILIKNKNNSKFLRFVLNFDLINVIKNLFN